VGGFLEVPYSSYLAPKRNFDSSLKLVGSYLWLLLFAWAVTVPLLLFLAHLPKMMLMLLPECNLSVEARATLTIAIFIAFTFLPMMLSKVASNVPQIQALWDWVPTRLKILWIAISSLTAICAVLQFWVIPGVLSLEFFQSEGGTFAGVLAAIFSLATVAATYYSSYDRSLMRARNRAWLRFKDNLLRIAASITIILILAAASILVYSYSIDYDRSSSGNLREIQAQWLKDELCRKSKSLSGSSEARAAAEKQYLACIIKPNPDVDIISECSNCIPPLVNLKHLFQAATSKSETLKDGFLCGLLFAFLLGLFFNWIFGREIALHGIYFEALRSAFSVEGNLVEAKKPKHIVNMAVADHLGPSDRNAHHVSWEAKEDSIDPYTAMAISGAAVAPSYGYHSSAPASFLLALFNLRLGVWCEYSNDKIAEFKSPFGLIFEMFSCFNAGPQSGKVQRGYLSDGGHFENLGVYEMFRREVPIIVAVDCSQDQGYEFEDLEKALRQVRIDFGVDIDIAPHIDLTDKNLRLVPRCAIVPFTYKGGTAGVFAYIKPVIAGDEPFEVQAYARRSYKQGWDFPQDETSHQFYDEEQFESYRKLGLHTATNALPDIASLELFLVPQYHPAFAVYPSPADLVAREMTVPLAARHTRWSGAVARIPLPDVTPNLTVFVENSRPLNMVSDVWRQTTGAASGVGQALLLSGLVVGGTIGITGIPAMIGITGAPQEIKLVAPDKITNPETQAAEPLIFNTQIDLFSREIDIQVKNLERRVDLLENKNVDTPTNLQGLIDAMKELTKSFSDFVAQDRKNWQRYGDQLGKIKSLTDALSEKIKNINQATSNLLESTKNLSEATSRVNSITEAINGATGLLREISKQLEAEPAGGN
jgi:hypothetical protein